MKRKKNNSIITQSIISKVLSPSLNCRIWFLGGAISKKQKLVRATKRWNRDRKARNICPCTAATDDTPNVHVQQQQQQSLDAHSSIAADSSNSSNPLLLLLTEATAATCCCCTAACAAFHFLLLLPAAFGSSVEPSRKLTFQDKKKTVKKKQKP